MATKAIMLLPKVGMANRNPWSAKFISAKKLQKIICETFIPQNLPLYGMVYSSSHLLNLRQHFWDFVALQEASK